MRAFVITLLVIGAIVAAVVIYLFVTTPDQPVALRFPLTGGQRQLLSRVPASAEAFTLIPSAALLHGQLAANPVTRGAMARWTQDYEMPRPWMLGRAGVVAWKSGTKTSYAARLDPVRALLVRLWLSISSSADVRWDGRMVIVNDTLPSAAPLDLDPILELTADLPPGDLLLVHQEKERGSFPPIGRPAVTSANIEPEEIVLVSRAETEDDDGAANVSGRFPRGAMLAAAFGSPPRLLSDLNRLLGTRVDALVDAGGAIAIYDVRTGGLLPRPKGLLILPADDEARAALRKYGDVIELVGETRDTGRELLVAFDRTSAEHYMKDTFVPAAWPANRWALRIEPETLVPVLQKVAGSAALRIATPRVHRAARDLRSWIGVLEHVDAIEAANSVSGGVEELRVRIVSK